MDGKRLTGKRTGFRDERAVAMEMIPRRRACQAESVRYFGGLDLHSGEPGARLRQRIEEEPALSQAVKEIEVIRGRLPAVFVALFFLPKLLGN